MPYWTEKTYTAQLSRRQYYPYPALGAIKDSSSYLGFAVSNNIPICNVLHKKKKFSAENVSCLGFYLTKYYSVCLIFPKLRFWYRSFRVSIQNKTWCQIRCQYFSFSYYLLSTFLSKILQKGSLIWMRIEYPKKYFLLFFWKVNFLVSSSFKNILVHSQCVPLKYAIILFINRNSLIHLL